MNAKPVSLSPIRIPEFARSLPPFMIQPNVNFSFSSWGTVEF